MNRQQFHFEKFNPMHLKSFIRHVGHHAPSSVPVTPWQDWPEFPESQKPSNQSPFRTVLWFHREVNNGVRILVEGRDKAAVDAYAKMITDNDANRARAAGDHEALK